MIILFQNILLLKEFLVCNGCFGLFTKTKNGSGTSFWCTFSAWFFHKNVPYLILYQLTKFQYHIYIFSFSRYQAKCVIKFLFRKLVKGIGTDFEDFDLLFRVFLLNSFQSSKIQWKLKSSYCDYKVYHCNYISHIFLLLLSC